MIVCSAIQFRIESTNEEVVLCGLRHGDIFKQLKSLGFAPRKGYTEIEQGFVDDNNNFLNREDALIHAKECGQITVSKSDRELLSEDLY